MALLPPALAVGSGLTVMTTLFVLLQAVAVMVSVKVYVVVAVGLTLGFALVDVNPDGLDTQLYVEPLTDAAPMVVLDPLQMEALLPAFAVGNGFTVTTTLFILLQPVAVIVSVTLYVVVAVGLTLGFAFVELNPDGLDTQL